jgi:hypothetical protein
VNKVNALTIGIDATNLRRGGGLTHLIELLGAVQPSSLGIERVVIWGGLLTLNGLEERSWLEKCNPSEIDKGLLRCYR